jgi:glycosyltransferase 2 family protein
LLGYAGLTLVFVVLSLCSIGVVNHLVAAGPLRIPPGLLSTAFLTQLAMLLLAYFFMDGLRLYCVVRALGYRVGLVCMARLVFINIFVSNITPLATGGGLAQIVYLRGQGVPVGAATAATSIRTVLAALVLFAAAPAILWSNPEFYQACLNRLVLTTVTVVSGLYLVLSWVLAFRLDWAKRAIFSGLALLGAVHLLGAARVGRLRRKALREVTNFSRAIHLFVHGNPVWSCLAVGATLLFLILLFSFSIVIIQGLGYAISSWTILAVQAVVTFFTYFAPTPGGTGVAEGGYGLLFAQLIRIQDLLVLTVLWRFCTIYCGMVFGGGILLWDLCRHNRSVGE